MTWCTALQNGVFLFSRIGRHPTKSETCKNKTSGELLVIVSPRCIPRGAGGAMDDDGRARRHGPVPPGHLRCPGERRFEKLPD